MKIIAQNKRAGYDFQLIEKFEAGMVLKGTEVKSLRAGKVTLTDAFVNIDPSMEAWVVNMNIAHYEFGNQNNHEEARKRKLLLKKEEIVRIYHKMKTQKLTIIATKIYFKDSLIKIEIALAKGKKQHDKREDEKEKSIEKNLRRGQYDE
jgi:SsrA-binding protein